MYTRMQVALDENVKKRGELEGKLNHEREKHQNFDRDAKDLESKFQVADKEHQVRLCAGLISVGSTGCVCLGPICALAWEIQILGTESTRPVATAASSFSSCHCLQALVKALEEAQESFKKFERKDAQLTMELSHVKQKLKKTEAKIESDTANIKVVIMDLVHYGEQ